MINVLHIYQNSKLGGIQLQILNLFKHYDRSVINPTFCCLGPKLEVGEEFERLGYDFVALGHERYSRFSPSIISELAALMKKKNIQVLRTHKYRAGFYGRLAAWRAGVPVVICSEHNSYHEKELRLLRRLTNRLLFSRTDVYVGVSEAIRSDLVRYDRLPHKRTRVIRNGVDLARFDPSAPHEDVRAGLSIPKDALLLVSIGRLAENKGYEYLLEGFGAIRSALNDRDIRLVIVGDGSYREILERMINERGLGDFVILTGQRTDVPDLLAASDVFVMPSIEEGLPNAMLEAMSMGLPVVATNVGGIPEALRDPEHGRIVGPRDPAALTRAIVEVAADPARAKSMGDAARAHVIEHFGIEATTGRWQSLYIELLSPKRLY